MILNMMTIQEIAEELGSGEVFAIEEFLELAEMGELDEDGYGYYHDGEELTERRVVLDPEELEDMQEQYPYVVWYN